MKKVYLSIALLSATAISLTLSSCRSIPKGAKAVKPFAQEKYLGKWFEIARFDYRFERNLNTVTANYSLREDGKIKVDNKGFNYKTEKWEQSTGKAKVFKDPNEGRFKVSFFGPFYSPYNVIALDKDYQYALVAGKNKRYLWILSRTQTIPENVKAEYLKIAQDIGFKTENLIWVKQNKEQ